MTSGTSSAPTSSGAFQAARAGAFWDGHAEFARLCEAALLTRHQANAARLCAEGVAYREIARVLLRPRGEVAASLAYQDARQMVRKARLKIEWLRRRERKRAGIHVSFSDLLRCIRNRPEVDDGDADSRIRFDYDRAADTGHRAPRVTAWDLARCEDRFLDPVSDEEFFRSLAHALNSVLRPGTV